MANGGFVDVSTFNLIGDRTPHGLGGPRLRDASQRAPRPDQRRHRRRGRRHDDPQRARRPLPGASSRTSRACPARPSTCTRRSSACPARSDDVPPARPARRRRPRSGRADYLTERRRRLDREAVRRRRPGQRQPDRPRTHPYTSETWQRPTDCVARDADGNPVVEQVLPPSSGGHDCLEAPLMSSQVGDNSVGDFMQVNGNYGFIAHRPRPDDRGRDRRAGSSRRATTSSRSSPRRTPTASRPTRSSRKRTSTSSRATSIVAPGETPAQSAAAEPARRSEPANAGDPAVPVRRPAPHRRRRRATGRDANFDVTDPYDTQGVYNPDLVDGGGSPFQGMRKPLCDDAARHRPQRPLGHAELPLQDVQRLRRRRQRLRPAPASRSRPHLRPRGRRPQPVDQPEGAVLRREVRHPATSRSASTTSRTGSSRRSRPTRTASTRSSCPRPRATTARCRRAPARASTASWRTTPASRAI